MKELSDIFPLLESRSNLLTFLPVIYAPYLTRNHKNVSKLNLELNSFSSLSVSEDLINETAILIIFGGNKKSL